MCVCVCVMLGVELCSASFLVFAPSLAMAGAQGYDKGGDATVLPCKGEGRGRRMNGWV